MVYEDGLGWPDSDSYATAKMAKTYFDSINFDYSSYKDAEIEAALIRATAYIDTYKRWPGRKENEEQGLEWPRTDAYDVNGYLLSGVPAPIRKATMEAAKLELVEPGYLATYSKMAVTREKVGDIEVQYSGADEKLKAVTQYLKKVVSIGGVRLER